MSTKITSQAALKNQIQILEIEQQLQWQEIKQDAKELFDSFTPSNQIKNVISEFTHSSDLKENIIDTGLSVSVGFLANKLVVGSSKNILSQITGDFIQKGVTNLIFNHASAIKSSLYNLLAPTKDAEKQTSN
jgi:hypothetical protein